MAFLAHTENEYGQPHHLDVHLKSTGALARSFAMDSNPLIADTAALAGLLHDAGKYRTAFQRYLIEKIGRRGDVETHHAVYGAALAGELRSIPLAYVIAGHHAGLHDASELQELFRTTAYKLPHSLTEIRERLISELGLKLEPVKDIFRNSFDKQFYSHNEVYVRMIFSLLVDADFLDTEAHFKIEARKSVALNAGDLLAKIIEAKDKKSRAAREKRSELELIDERDRVFAACLEAAQNPQGFFSLTVPTGGGKTLSSAAFALNHAQRHGLRRVIFVIPYLSIIEQNASELRRILDPYDEGVVIESHSAVGVKSKDASNEASEGTAKLAAENWDAPIIITTAVQFIESLFASKPSRCRKVHNIARSVVVFDEAQTLPIHLLNPLLSVLRELQASYGVSFVFSTATQPAFRRSLSSLNKGFTENEITEITSDTARTFKRLARVDFLLPQVNETRSWSDVAGEMKRVHQSLSVVNTRRDARTLYEELRQNLSDDGRSAVFHLSSAMCAEHRLHVIGEMHEPRAGSVRARLLEGAPCRVVSTQLVEAGVDVDFPLVLRALAPLDSIVQAAGRCNRENNLRDEQGKRVRGRVVVFRPQEARLPGGDYRARTDITATMLSTLDSQKLTEDPTIFSNYFSQVFQLSSTDAMEKGDDNIEENRRQMNFRKVAHAARVIKDEGTSCIAPFDDRIKDLIDEIRGRPQIKGKPRFTRDDLRRLQRYIVNLRSQDFITLQTMGQLQPLLPNLELYVLSKGSYHAALGVVIGERSLDDFIQ